MIRTYSRMLKYSSYISHGTAHQNVNFCQFAKEAKEYPKVNEDILTPTEGYGTQMCADHNGILNDADHGKPLFPDL